MSAGISRGALSLVTTDPMDSDQDQQDQGPVTGPDAIDTVVAGAIDDPGLAASNRLGVLRPASERSTLYASIVGSIFMALQQDESFECLIERPTTGLELVHILIAIRYYELTGELSKIEARELRNSCESNMREAATATKRKNKVTPKDIYAAEKAAETFTIDEISHTSTSQLLSEAISESRQTGNFTCLTETDVKFEERPILEAIFWAKRLGKITDNQAFTLFKRCLGSMSEAGIEPQAIEFIGIQTAGLFNSKEEARKVFKMMHLSPVEIRLFKDELDAILGKNAAETESGIDITKTEPDTGDWAPVPSRRGWFPEAFIVEKSEKKPLMPTGISTFLQNRETRRAALEVVALAAILAIGGKVMNMVNQKESPQVRWEIPESAIATNAPESPKEPFSLGSITITVNPTMVATDAATKAPEVIVTPPVSVAAAPQPPQATPSAPQEQPTPTTPTATQEPTAVATAQPTPATQPPEAPQTRPTPQPQPVPQQAQPTPPETVAQNTITLPISTKPGAYGGVALDESASKKLWESAGYTVKARMGAGGKKVFILSKNGKSFIISDTKIATGQAEIAASIE